ncbi:MAG: ThuA domain-containing protein [Bacteroidaceae bacterium]|nr:ThuA domain-containing protein [Bacteroidaceae bacterium]
MKRRIGWRWLAAIVLCLLAALSEAKVAARRAAEPRKVLVLAERGGLHEGFTAAGLEWLERQKERFHMELTVLNSAKDIGKGELMKYQLVLQLNYPPYAWSSAAQKDMQRYIDKGVGSYIGFHHASLLGEFDGYPMWDWFSEFLGKIRYQNYIADRCDATVQLEDLQHPVTQGVPRTFTIQEDEWYTYDVSPRRNAHVLANVDESTYSIPTDIKMGDHPVVWSNQKKKARNVYFQFGHSRSLFQNRAFIRLFENAIQWTLEDDGQQAKDDGQQVGQEGYPANYARAPRFRALVHYEPHAEEAHVQFDKQAIEFFRKLTYGEGWLMDVTTSLADYPYERLKDYSIIISLNAMPGGKAQRDAFEQYIENGGGWMGFHASAYNDKGTNWPWLNEFLGCGTFYCNNWPPQPALVQCDTQQHPVTNSLPQSFVAPASEFYQWNPSPRKNPDVDVLLSISQKMYPFGLKDVVRWGDFPIVWTNRKYRMIYLNMGHGDEGFIDATQNLLFVNAFRWVVSRDPKGNPFEK